VLGAEQSQSWLSGINFRWVHRLEQSLLAFVSSEEQELVCEEECQELPTQYHLLMPGMFVSKFTVGWNWVNFTLGQ
jgi:hypothetical protein